MQSLASSRCNYNHGIPLSILTAEYLHFERPLFSLREAFEIIQNESDPIDNINPTTMAPARLQLVPANHERSTNLSKHAFQ